MLKKFEVKTAKREELINISAFVENAVKESGVKNGIVVIFCPHTTAAITINENADPDVCLDMIKGLKNISPADKNYAHIEGNSDAHIKSSLIGASQTVIIDEGSLVLGTWQGVYFCEFDGPRTRTVFVKIV